MNSLLSRALELQHAARELMYSGVDGKSVYSDTFCRLNKEILVKCDSLFLTQSSDVEEEANLCLALLMGYNATIYNDGDKEQKKQAVLQLRLTYPNHLQWHELPSTKIPHKPPHTYKSADEPLAKRQEVVPK